ncbi:hypothetical protein OEZ85_006036 [Tetradesmus obliquus]|uniref:Uncharacterized protein n=1 Tax=Tetradesmus obliquus TaxID=3088 RepID=A0ABY8UFB2_TETOB|nr:hypothetical protein OEZ85_006036 [Tetradesmus obliquus]
MTELLTVERSGASNSSAPSWAPNRSTATPTAFPDRHSIDLGCLTALLDSQMPGAFTNQQRMIDMSDDGASERSIH